MYRHPFEYGAKEVAHATIERLLLKAELSEIDSEILRLRLYEEWLFEDIANYIGRKYLGRGDHNPLWERTIRYRLNKTLATLRELAVEEDFNLKGISKNQQNIEEKD